MMLVQSLILLSGLAIAMPITNDVVNVPPSRQLYDQGVDDEGVRPPELGGDGRSQSHHVWGPWAKNAISKRFDQGVNDYAFPPGSENAGNPIPAWSYGQGGDGAGGDGAGGDGAGGDGAGGDGAGGDGHFYPGWGPWNKAAVTKRYDQGVDDEGVRPPELGGDGRSQSHSVWGPWAKNAVAKRYDQGVDDEGVRPPELGGDGRSESHWVWSQFAKEQVDKGN
jgi:hypothetical protein